MVHTLKTMLENVTNSFENVRKYQFFSNFINYKNNYKSITWPRRHHLAFCNKIEEKYGKTKKNQEKRKESLIEMYEK